MVPPSVVVFIDYENAVRSALEKWGAPGQGPREFQLDPLNLAQLIVARRPPGGYLKEVRVYRGRPEPRKEPTLARVNDRQYHRWVQDDRVHVIKRALRYPSDWGEPGCRDRPREKGIDVRLALDLYRFAVAKDFDAGVVVSRDSDLLPAIELAREADGAHIEAATWEGSTRLRVDGGKKLFCHMLTFDEFELVRDKQEYNF